MDMIPDSVYEHIERMLRRRKNLVRKAGESLARARAKATDIQAPGGGGITGKGGLKTSRTEKGAMALIRAEKRYQNAMKWMDVFRRMDEIFPKDSPEGQTAALIYGLGTRQSEVARICGCSRQTIRTRQDRYVIRCAFVAAGMGLIREEVNGRRGEADQAE